MPPSQPDTATPLTAAELTEIERQNQWINDCPCELSHDATQASLTASTALRLVAMARRVEHLEEMLEGVKTLVRVGQTISDEDGISDDELYTIMVEKLPVALAPTQEVPHEH